MSIPQHLRYTKDHEWISVDGNIATVGITHYAQDQLGDIVFVELPAVGHVLERGASFGTVESVKAVEEMYAPVSVVVTARNEVVIERPELLQQDPYGEGWLLEVEPTDPGQIEDLMAADAYRSKVEGA